MRDRFKTLLPLIFLITTIFFIGCISEKMSEEPSETDVKTDSADEVTPEKEGEELPERLPSCSTEGNLCATTSDCCQGLGLNCVDSRCLRCANLNEACGGNVQCCSEDLECSYGACILKEENVLQETEEEAVYSIQAYFERGVKRENIAIFVSNDVYSSLSAEIERYKNDIEEEWNHKYRETGVTIIRRDSFTKEYVKSRVSELWKNENLAGVVLIGDIPHYTFRPTKDLALYDDSNNPSDIEVPSDFYYIDVEDTCNYPDSYECTRNPEIWLGRITPPGSDDVKLLKGYFDRNHAYRTGSLQYNDELLLYGASGFKDTPSYGLNKQKAIDQIEKENKLSSGYHTEGKYLEELKIILADEPNSGDDALYFEELKKPYKYVYYHGHGLSTWSENDITPEVIKTSKPQALYYSLQSCSNGDFTVEDYNAGWYLFSGKGLVVTAGTVPIYGVFPPVISGSVSLLERGLSFGETFGPSQFYSITILGDPTLHLYDKIPSNAELRLSEKSIDVVKSATKTRIPIKIQNSGSETLKLYYLRVEGLSLYIQGCKDSEFGNYIKAWYCPEYAHYPTYEIEPDEEALIEVVVYPGTLQQDDLIFKALTNDKYDPLIEIPITFVPDSSGSTGSAANVQGDSPVKGSENAPVTITQFSDFQSNIDSRWYMDSKAHLEKQYVNTGKVKLVYVHFPSPEAIPAALASECAHEQGRFWDYHDVLFENQDLLGDSNYKQWAGELGLNQQQFNDCYDDRKYEARIEADITKAKNLGISIGPSFFVNDVFIEGRRSFNTFQPIIEDELDG